MFCDYRRALGGIASFAVLLLGSGQVHARGYHHYNPSAAQRQHIIQAAQSNLASARKVLAIAQVQLGDAQSKIDACNDRIRGAKSALDSADSDEHTSHNSLVAIQARLVEEAGPNSEIGKAYTELLASIEEHDAALHQALVGGDYKTRVAAISDPGDHLKELPLIREEILKHDERYQTAHVRLKLAKIKFGQLRTDMVRQSPEWMAASDDVREAWKAHNHAELEAINGAMSRMRHKYRLHDAQAAMAAAQATIAQSEAILRRLGVKPPPAPPPVPPSTPGK